MGREIDREFFNRKRPWSHIKDRVLGPYLPLYFAKVAKLGRQLIVVDAFAGPGVYFDPQTGVTSYGSPIILADAAAQWLEGRCPYKLFFGNRDREHHNRLKAELRSRQIPPSRAEAVALESSDLLAALSQVITDQTLLLYQDPFGYKGCEFGHLRPFLERPRTYSTEIILNLNVADLHRLAARHAVSEGRITTGILANHSILTAVLNGEWWKAILLNPYTAPEEMERQVIKEYMKQYAPYFRYHGCCPVPETANGQVKYYITFFSNHADALISHNDNMCDAYNQYITKEHWSGPLFEEMLMVRWQDTMARDYRLLDCLILEEVAAANKNGYRPSRRDAWIKIISNENYFRRWTQKEYRARVRFLSGQGTLAPIDVRGTGRLNDDTQLHVPGVQMPSIGERELRNPRIA